MKVIYQLTYMAAFIYAFVGMSKSYESYKITFAIVVATIFLILWAIQSYIGYTKTAKTGALFVSFPGMGDGVPQIVNCAQIVTVFYEDGVVTIGMSNNRCAKISMDEEAATKFIMQFKTIANGMKKDFDM